MHTGDWNLTLSETANVHRYAYSDWSLGTRHFAMYHIEFMRVGY